MHELQMKRKEGEEGPRKRGGNRTKKTKQESSDEEDDCAAVNCLRPSGKDDVAYSQRDFNKIPSLSVTNVSDA